MNKRFAKLILSRMDHKESQGHDHATDADINHNDRRRLGCTPGAEAALVGGTGYPLDTPSPPPGASAFDAPARHRFQDLLSREHPTLVSPGWSNNPAAWPGAFPADVTDCGSPRSSAAPVPDRRSPTTAAGGGGASDDRPTKYDVLNGRGQGVQRHPGNVKYRTLVYLNKGLYAKCPRSDKAKISRGIVAAVRELGGRFLELDERSGLYRDVGDKKAYEKTSQALREGQTRIRRELYAVDDHRPYGGGDPTSSSGISAEGYFGYSARILESLYRSEGGGDDDVRTSSPCAFPGAVAASGHRGVPAARAAACDGADENGGLSVACV